MEKIDGIAEELNTTFKTTDIVKIDNTIKAIQESNKDPNRLTLEDKQYLQMELKDMISSMKFVQKILEDQISKPPFRATEVEAFAMYSEKLINALKELRVLNMDIINTELAQRRLDKDIQKITGNVTNNIQNNISITALDLDKMLEDAQKNRRIDQIDVDFDVDDQIR